MPFGCSSSLSLGDSLTLVTPISLALVSAAVVALLAASLGLVAQSVFARSDREAGPVSWRSGGLWLGILFLVVFAAKLLVMRDVPVTTPFWDEWDGEAAGLFLPVQHCALPWRVLFSLHNEHRVFFSRLLALDLLVLNGQWDPRLGQVVNALIHAITIAIVAAVFWRASQWRRLDYLVLICVLAAAPPAGWENTLIGFQSAFYFLLLFGVLTIWLTTAYPPGSGRWWIGCACGVCGIFTAAGGFLAPAAVASVTACNWVRQRRAGRDVLTTIFAAMLIVVVGVAVMSPPLAHHAALKAGTIRDFATAFGHNLAWPWTTSSPLLSVVLWAPVAALLPVALRRGATPTACERLVLIVALWIAFQAAAIAYGRGSGGIAPISRYQDLLSIGFVANGVAILAWYDRIRLGGVKRVGAVLCVLWVLFAVVGVKGSANRAMAELRVWRGYFSAQTASVRAYLITNDRAAFVAKPPGVEIPYPDPGYLAGLLDREEIRRILPAAVRTPVAAPPQAISNDAFVADGSPLAVHDPLVPAWGSYGRRRRADQGRFQSEPIKGCSQGGRLLFQVSGYLGQPHHYLAVKELKSGREFAVQPAGIAGDSWLPVAVRCPGRPFSIVAIDDTPDSWFAFSEPVETGPLSLLSENVIDKAGGLLLVSLGLALVAARWTDARAVT